MGYDQQCLGLKIWKWLIRQLMAFFYKEIDDQSLNFGVHFDFYTQSLTSLKWGYKLI